MTTLMGVTMLAARAHSNINTDEVLLAMQDSLPFSRVDMISGFGIFVIQIDDENYTIRYAIDKLLSINQIKDVSFNGKIYE
jgi:hypothetical protein